MRARHLVWPWLIAAANAFAQASPGVYADRIVLGQSAKLSGTSGTQAGRQYRDGLMLAFGGANRQGGVHGRRIELVSLDDENDPKKAAANTRVLIEEHKVFAIVGSTFTNTVKAALPLVREAGVTMVAPYTGFAELYEGRHPEVFVLRASFADELESIVRHIRTVGYEGISLVHYANPLGDELRRDVDEKLRGAGRQLQSAASMPINSKDSDEAVKPALRSLASSCPRLVVLGVSGRDAAAIVRGLNRGACAGVRYLARSLVDIAMLRKELGDGARGVMVTQVVPNPLRSLHPLVRDYRDALARRDASAAPDLTEFEGFIAGRFVVLSLQRAGRSPDRAAFVRALEAQTLDGPNRYRIEFGPGKRVGTRYINIVMMSEQGRIAD